MIQNPFDYVRATTLSEALAALAGVSHGRPRRAR
mgnify:CR=1 FL=1